MKVEGPGKTSVTKGVSKTGAKKGAGDASFSGLVDAAEEAQEKASVSASVSIGGIDALLAMQGASDSTSGEGGKQARRRAEGLLEQLERLRMGLLTGTLSPSVLQGLTHTINSHRDKVMDPKLAAILDEIELRAQVELAKLGKL